MSDFKLLAIRPLKGCSPKYRKNLKEGEFYTFYNEYTFSEKNGKIEIEHNKELVSDNLYKLQSLKDLPNINISAVVGTNGSGKSTLFELLYLSVYLISYKHLISHNLLEFYKNVPEFINNYHEIKSLELENSINFLDFKSKLINLTVDDKNLGFVINTLKPLNDLTKEKIYLELYYLIDTKVNCIKINSKETINKNFFDQTIGENDLKYFYSIALNYSIHGLNSDDKNLKWIDSLFHKNDGYTTPIVLNPKR
jgi:hypothetical protein